MVGHDSFKQLEDMLGSDEAIKKISPKFSELSLDLNEISKHCKNPMFIAVLLFKLAEEREKTNKLLAEIHDKFDSIMFKMKAPQITDVQQRESEQPSSILSEQDQMIMHMVHSNGKATAEEVRAGLGFRELFLGLINLRGCLINFYYGPIKLCLLLLYQVKRSRRVGFRVVIRASSHGSLRL